MNPIPPLSQPSGAICSNCGTVQLTTTNICVHCGAPLQTPGARKRMLHPALRIPLTIFLFCGAVAFGGAGACMGIVSIASIAGWSNDLGLDFGFYLLTGAAILIGLACLWFINKINNKI